MNGDFETVPQTQIDLVYTWVNSADSVWISDFKEYSKKLHPDKKSKTKDRFRDCLELKYSILSAYKYVDFIRNIYIVVANKSQIPDWLQKLVQSEKIDPKIIIITHTDIFPKEFHTKLLPTFNSVSIEIHLHRIPNLSEKYLYLNDDMFFGRQVRLDDFLDSNNRSYIFLDRNSNVSGGIFSSKINGNYTYADAINYTNRVLHKTLKIKCKKYLLQHLPYIHHKSCDLEIYQFLKRENLYLSTCSRFRENRNIKTQSLFYPYYAISRGYAVPYYERKGIKVSKNHQQYYSKILKTRPKLFCLNKLPKLDEPLLKFYKKMYN